VSSAINVAYIHRRHFQTRAETRLKLDTWIVGNLQHQRRLIRWLQHGLVRLSVSNPSR
jgi:hypothetical protein